jgi:nucleoside-diphosphate-sugar epimerase
MKVLLTGGSGNLGRALVPRLLEKGDTPVILDVRAPRSLNEGAVFIKPSVLNRSKLTEIFRGCDGIVHIAARHGIHVAFAVSLLTLQGQLLPIQLAYGITGSTLG